MSKQEEKECIFCKIARGEIDSDEVADSENFFAIRDIHPKAHGHTLIISKRHFVTLLDLPAKLGSELVEIMKKVSSDLMDKKFGDGFNIVMNNLEVAGQIIMHAHLHIIPRKDGDGLRSMV